MFAVEADHDDVVGEIVRNRRDVVEAAYTKTVVPCRDVVDLGESLSQGGHGRAHVGGGGRRIWT